MRCENRDSATILLAHLLIISHGMEWYVIKFPCMIQRFRWWWRAETWMKFKTSPKKVWKERFEIKMKETYSIVTCFRELWLRMQTKLQRNFSRRNIAKMHLGWTVLIYRNTFFGESLQLVSRKFPEPSNVQSKLPSLTRNIKWWYRWACLSREL